MSVPDPVLSIQNLTITLPLSGDRREAVKDLSLDVARGEIVCIVGESGSGKSVTAFTIMNLLARGLVVQTGKMWYGGRDLLALNVRDRRELSGKSIAMVFQEPMSALNPVLTIGWQIEEVLKIHERTLSASQRRSKVLEILDAVHLPDPQVIARAYPSQISGGQRQRVMIAMAIILKPDILIADEPTTALDVTTQAQILRLLDELRRETGMGVLFVTHDIGVVRDIADRVIVMRGGRVVEAGTASDVLDNPKEDYSRLLINSIPSAIPPEVKRTSSDDVLLTVRGVDKNYRRGVFTVHETKAVCGVNLTIKRGEVVSIVGESGSGKSTLARIIAGLVPSSAGSVEFNRSLEVIRGGPYRQVQMVFQDPNRSLNPRIMIGSSLMEGPINMGVSRAEALMRVEALIDRVGLDRRALSRYPHQFSGGQRQRICIARALAMSPSLLVADEAVSALDVTVQKQVLDLLAELREELELSILFITHDLRVAAQISDRICVMQRGRIVEEGRTTQIFSQPSSEYTRQLLNALPGRLKAFN
ncbi:ABC transporter ATP-binding protein [Rhizobium laguerreae]|uniref:dipeptide ABC transporter ATP-binding protein n=1 Tax=Rhizobium laguerreae TaxID=1076926 RepID=UPI001C9043FA|nr:ABC transporter ATP-binding protein [Rhizobium laguerreae]MBY3307389.1 ABC transporter ATP-binding protein [Rhizobium laguerreae]